MKIHSFSIPGKNKVNEDCLACHMFSPFSLPSRLANSQLESRNILIFVRPANQAKSNVKPANVKENRMADVMPLMSSRMKEIIESELKGTEHVRGLRACINGKTETYQYYVPMFCQELDTLNREKTRYTDEEKEWIIQPCYRKDAIPEYAMFHGPYSYWQLTEVLHVNNEIRKKLKKAGITGISFTDCWTD
ncbi:MAG: hypothetical protein NC308_07205 [Clostridium sp.]|nr:hypothetical protein [Bacteroides sp.]MCM1198659.1 hypothetical protein [Clostridium sp.]